MADGVLGRWLKHRVERMFGHCEKQIWGGHEAYSAWAHGSMTVQPFAMKYKGEFGILRYCL